MYVSTELLLLFLLFLFYYTCNSTVSRDGQLSNNTSLWRERLISTSPVITNCPPLISGKGSENKGADRASNSGPLALESHVLPTALRSTTF